VPRGSVRGVNPLTLTFPDPALERAWWEDWAQRSGDRQRVTLAALLGLVAAFAVVDLLAFPQVVAWLWGLRAGSIALAAPALLAFGEPVRAARWGQVAVAWAAVAVLGAMFPMSALVAPAATGHQLVLAIPALVVALLALFGASGLRFAWAGPLGVVVVGGFLGALRTSPAATAPYLLLAGAGGGAALCVGLLVSWSRESHARGDFLARRELDSERARSERLLRVLMPDVLARRLAEGPGPHLTRGDATILFLSVTGYDPARGSPLDAVAVLDRVVGSLDEAAVAAGVERVKTIGATLLFATGVPDPDPGHLARAARFALATRALVARLGEADGLTLAARIGLASGPVVFGVVGRTRFAFDVWGDTVNTASRLESHGEAGRIQVALPVAVDLSSDFVLAVRGELEVKGKGRLTTSWLEGER
jgi:class 3 adenylate cyclase